MANSKTQLALIAIARIDRIGFVPKPAGNPVRLFSFPALAPSLSCFGSIVGQQMEQNFHPREFQA